MSKPESITIDDLVVQIIRTARRKTLSIEVSHQGVKARAPLRMRHSSIVDFVIAKQSWINRHRQNLPARKPELRLIDGAELWLHGERQHLSIIQGSNKLISLTQDSIVVPVRKSKLPLEQTVKNKLLRWYKSIAYDELLRKVAYHSRQMNIPTNKSLNIKVRDYKRRWGSCDSNGDLSFNWRIIQAPSGILDYVVVHELAHCHEFNHSKKFWRIVEKQMPDWKQRQSWLHKNGAALYQL